MPTRGIVSEVAIIRSSKRPDERPSARARARARPSPSPPELARARARPSTSPSPRPPEPEAASSGFRFFSALRNLIGRGILSL